MLICSMFILNRELFLFNFYSVFMYLYRYIDNSNLWINKHYSLILPTNAFTDSSQFVLYYILRIVLNIVQTAFTKTSNS